MEGILKASSKVWTELNDFKSDVWCFSVKLCRDESNNTLLKLYLKKQSNKKVHWVQKVKMCVQGILLGQLHWSNPLVTPWCNLCVLMSMWRFLIRTQAVRGEWPYCFPVFVFVLFFLLFSTWGPFSCSKTLENLDTSELSASEHGQSLEYGRVVGAQ